MKKYDLVLLLDHEIKKEDREIFLSDLESKLEKKVVEKDDIGLLDLYHELNEKKWKDRAYFISYFLELDNEALDMIKQFLLYNKSVLRYSLFWMNEQEIFFKYNEINKRLEDMIESRWTQRFGQKVRFYSNDKNIQYLNRKAIPILKKYISRFGDIKPRAYTGNSISRQKQVRKCIIRSRELWLLEYVR